MLNTRAIRDGTLLLSLGATLSTAIKFVSVPILARLLSPTEFGMAGTALVLVAFASVLSGGTGLGTAVTYFKAQRETYDNVAAWLALCLGVLLAGLSWGFSDTLARLWGSEESAIYIRVVAVFFPFSVLAGIGYALLARDMSFRTITIINVLASILSTVTAISMAYTGWGAWSLIWQYVVFNVIKCCGYFMYAGYRPSLKLAWGEVRDIFPFAYRLTLAETLMWASSEGPFVLVSRMLGVEFGGVYRIFQRFAALPREALGENLSRAAYVGMADGSRNNARHGFLWSTKMSTFFLGSIFCWLAALSQPLTHFLLGSQYYSYWPLAGILSIGLAGQSLGYMVVPFLKARGHTGVVLVLSFVRTFVILFGTWLGLWWSGSIIWAVVGIATGMILATVMLLTYLGITEKFRFSQLAETTLKPLIFGVVTGAFAFTVDHTLAKDLPDLIRILIGSAGGAVLLIGLVRLFAPADFHALIGELKGMRRRKKS